MPSGQRREQVLDAALREFAARSGIRLRNGALCSPKEYDLVIPFGG
jgi:hypothetical protein